MERARRDEQNVVGRNHPVLGVDGSPFHNRQNVPLHALAAHIRPMPGLAPRDLVDLVQKYDPRVLHPLHRQPRHLVHVDQPRLLLLHQVLEGLHHLHLPLLGALAKQARKHVLDIHVHIFRPLRGHELEARLIAVAHIDLHHPLIQLALAELLAQLLPRALVARLVLLLRSLVAARLALDRAGNCLRVLRQLQLHHLHRADPSRSHHHRGRPRALRRRRNRLRRHGRQQQIEQPVLGVQLGLVLHVLHLLLAHHVDGDLHQVAHNRLHVAPHISHLGKLRRLHLQERRAGQLGQPPRNLRLAHARRPNHDDVLGHDVFGQLRRQLLPSHPVPQRNRHRALGRALPHHIFVQLRHNLARSHLIQRQSLVVRRPR